MDTILVWLPVDISVDGSSIGEISWFSMKHEILLMSFELILSHLGGFLRVLIHLLDINRVDAAISQYLMAAWVKVCLASVLIPFLIWRLWSLKQLSSEIWGIWLSICVIKFVFPDYSICLCGRAGPEECANAGRAARDWDCGQYPSLPGRKLFTVSKV